jgi:anti-repressor protein
MEKNMEEQNGLRVFTHEELGKVRVVVRDGEPWFVAKDVCELLDLGNPRSSVALLDADEADVHTVDTSSQRREMSIVSEAGMYSLILKSRKPEAKAVKRWITHDVMPSIRKTGGYSQSNIMEIASKPENIVNMAKTIVQFDLRIKELEGKIEEDAPKLLMVDSVLASEDVISMGVMSKFASNRLGNKIGRDRLFEIMRVTGYFLKAKGQNVLTQKGVRCRWFRQIEQNIHGRIYIKIYVTTKGQVGIIHLLEKMFK